MRGPLEFHDFQGIYEQPKAHRGKGPKVLPIHVDHKPTRRNRFVDYIDPHGLGDRFFGAWAMPAARHNRAKEEREHAEALVRRIMEDFESEFDLRRWEHMEFFFRKIGLAAQGIAVSP